MAEEHRLEGLLQCQPADQLASQQLQPIGHLTRILLTWTFQLASYPIAKAQAYDHPTKTAADARLHQSLWCIQSLCYLSLEIESAAKQDLLLRHTRWLLCHCALISLVHELIKPPGRGRGRETARQQQMPPLLWQAWRASVSHWYQHTRCPLDGVTD